jgi:hypothetical protein
LSWFNAQRIPARADTELLLFVRWDGQGERFNVEATSHGLNTFDDDYYRKWPFPITAEEELAEGTKTYCSAASRVRNNVRFRFPFRPDGSSTRQRTSRRKSILVIFMLLPFVALKRG